MSNGHIRRALMNGAITPILAIAATGYGSWWAWPEFFGMYTFASMPMSVLGRFLLSVLLGVVCLFLTVTFLPWAYGRWRSTLD